MTDFLHSRYRLVEVLGQGAMGVVWRAHDSVLQRDIAIKELRAVLGGDPAEALERFLVEARAAARLAHPNIVRIHDVFRESDRVVIAMELLRGPTLDQVVATSGAQSPATVRAIMAQVAQALAVAHGGGVVHRDLKPDNIFWTPEGRAVVADFGLARIGAGRGTAEGTVMGTPGYMAPEQVRGVVAGPATDVFGWGAVAYELASGRPPFGDPDGTDPAALAYRVVHEEPPPLSLRADPSLAALISRTMAKDPSRRPADGGVLAAAMGSPAPAAAPPPRARRVSSPPPRRRSRPPVVGPRNHKPARPSTRGRPLAVVLGVVGVVVVLAAVGLVAAGSNGNEAKPVDEGVTVPTPTTIPPKWLPNSAGEITPRQYVTTAFDPKLALEFGPGWQITEGERPDKVSFSRVDPAGGGYPKVKIMQVKRVLNPDFHPKSPEAKIPAPPNIADWLRSNPRLEAEEPVTVPVASGTAQRIDLAVVVREDFGSRCNVSGATGRNSEGIPCALLFELESSPRGESPTFSILANTKVRVYVFKIQEQTVVIAVEATAAQFPSATALAEGVINTVRAA